MNFNNILIGAMIIFSWVMAGYIAIRLCFDLDIENNQRKIDTVIENVSFRK